MKRLFDFFSSVKLTMVVLLGLAAVAVGGTIWPVEQGMVQRFELYYQSIWFRLLLGLLALNLAACTWRTFLRVAGEKKRLLNVLENLQEPAAQEASLPAMDTDVLIERLQAQGYRTTRLEDRVLARRGMLGRWVKELEEDESEAFRGNGKQTSEQALLRQLREENRRLKMARDILKNLPRAASVPHL